MFSIVAGAFDCGVERRRRFITVGTLDEELNDECYIHIFIYMTGQLWSWQRPPATNDTWIYIIGFKLCVCFFSFFFLNIFPCRTCRRVVIREGNLWIDVRNEFLFSYLYNSVLSRFIACFSYRTYTHRHTVADTHIPVASSNTYSWFDARIRANNLMHPTSRMYSKLLQMFFHIDLREAVISINSCQLVGSVGQPT